MGTTQGPHVTRDAERPARPWTSHTTLLAVRKSASDLGRTRYRYFLGVKWSQVQILSARPMSARPKKCCLSWYRLAMGGLVQNVDGHAIPRVAVT